MSGFVYIWFDRKHKRYYIGSHWGSPDDGYICSSNWMRDAYRRRPKDFKRRIISTVTTTRKELFEEEQRFFDMIKVEELGKRYYNLCKSAKNHWSTDEETTKTVGQKISAKKKAYWQSLTEEQKQKIKDNLAKGSARSWTDPKRREEHVERMKNCDRERISETSKERWANTEYKAMMSTKISAAHKKLWKDPEYRIDAPIRGMR